MGSESRHGRILIVPNRDIIVIISGSSGATVPLKDILGRLPVDVPSAVFVVLHVPARGNGVLSTVARAAGKLPVTQAANDLPIQNGTVYLATPDHYLLIADGHLMPGRGPRETWSVRPSIRYFALRHCITDLASSAWPSADFYQMVRRASTQLSDVAGWPWCSIRRMRLPTRCRGTPWRRVPSISVCPVADVRGAGRSNIEDMPI